MAELPLDCVGGIGIYVQHRVLTPRKGKERKHAWLGGGACMLRSPASLRLRGRQAPAIISSRSRACPTEIMQQITRHTE
jgi:hypothetical protein